MRKRHSRLSTNAKLPIEGASLALLVVLGLMIFCPLGAHSVQATDIEPLAETAKLKAETYVYSTLAVSLSESISMDVTPKAKGSFASGEADLKVTTNNTTGYVVYMQTGDGSSALKHANGAVDAEISPISGTMTEATIGEHLNEWGYTIKTDSTPVYQAIPRAGGKAIITTDKLAAADSYKLGFGVSVSPTLPAGNYYNSVVVSVVANPIAVHTLSGITFMQEMSPYVCDYSDEDEANQLIDQRDGKSYWVGKLKDGHCWMQQNLSLDLDVDSGGNAVAVAKDGKTTVLTNANTNIATNNWNSGTGYAPLKTMTVAPSTDYKDSAKAYSWSPNSDGNIILTNPVESKLCPMADGGTQNDVVMASAALGSLSSACPEFFKTITNNMKDNFKATNTESISTDGKSYDAHYLVGNWYNWGAATAGTLESLAGINESTNAPGSICSKGWRLPAFVEQQTMLNVYGAYTNVDNASVAPVYAVFAGRISPNDGSLRNAGGRVFYWSGTTNPPYTYGYSMNHIYIDTDNEKSTRYNGYSVRCIAE